MSAGESLNESLAVREPGSGAADASADRRQDSGSGGWYAGAVVLGAVLIVITAIKQPFSYDELTQIATYGSNDVGTVIGATRQPPIDPVLGAIFQHIFGLGQLQDRLVPVLAGIGTLIMMSLLLRRLGLGAAGAYAVWVLATTPLMIRYSAYTRPYMLPMLEMTVFAYAALRWLQERSRRWLGVTAAAAVILPLTRVPEPCVFLAITAAILGWLAYRKALPWDRARPVTTVAVVALLAVGVPLYLVLASQTKAFWDPSPPGIADRFGAGVHEVIHFFFPLLGTGFPWWPVTTAAVIAALVIPASRRRLFGWFMFWPLLAAPIAFAVAYHFLNPTPFQDLPYRVRAVSFFVPPFILAMAALASVVARPGALSRGVRIGLAALLGAVIVGQLPGTAKVVLQNASPDFGEISRVLTNDVPTDAIVLYDRPTPVGQSRQPFLGSPRYMGDTPFVTTLAEIPGTPGGIPDQGPVYVLINGQCAKPGRCLPNSNPWDEPVAGWHIVYEHERFTLYAPDSGQAGRAGTVAALTVFGSALGPELGYVETYGAASMLAQDGDEQAAHDVIAEMYQHTSAALADQLRARAVSWELDPFASNG